MNNTQTRASTKTVTATLHSVNDEYFTVKIDYPGDFNFKKTEYEFCYIYKTVLNDFDVLDATQKIHDCKKCLVGDGRICNEMDYWIPVNPEHREVLFLVVWWLLKEGEIGQELGFTYE